MSNVVEHDTHCLSFHDGDARAGCSRVNTNGWACSEEKAEHRVEKAQCGGSERDSSLPLTLVFAFLATGGRGMCYRMEV